MVTLFIHNAHILSFHPGFRQEEADALAIEGDRIAAVGRFADLQSLIDPGTQVIDALGKTIMPGLHDTHIHIWKVGNLKTYMLDVRASTSLDDLLSRLEEYHRRYPEISWITARGFNEAAWEDGRMPTKQDLDRVIPGKPVYLVRTCAHIAVCNSRALELSGIDADTIAPEGGIIHRYESGRPSGILSETALGLVTPHLPPYHKEELKTMVRAARDEFYRFGITAATDPAVDPLLLEAYYEMEQSGELGFRLQAIPILLPDGGLRPYPLPEVFSSPFMTVNTVKFFSDGGLSGKTAALKRPYKGTGGGGASAGGGGGVDAGAVTAAEYGVLRLNGDQYRSLCNAAQENGLGIATHAIGDAAIEWVIDAYAEFRQRFPQGHLRIEHLGLPEEKHLRAMAANHIATSMQTIFLSELGKNFVKYLDNPYLEHCYPVRSVLDHGILVALSSDAPVVQDFNPFKGMEAAITRRSNEGKVISAGQAITIEEALAAYTYSAARISDTPDLGSLEAGKMADFIVLDKDPLVTPVDQLTNIRVQQTYVGGRCVWAK